MKLRFRANTLRLRVNQNEVKKLAAGEVLKEKVEFPGNTALTYLLRPGSAAEAQAFFADGSIQISAPKALVSEWAANDDIGLSFTLITGAEPLKIMIEKDLECTNGPEEEKDPHAFSRGKLFRVC